jgi:hypothetical protein
MTKWIYVPVILIALTMAANIPTVALAQNSQPVSVQTDQMGRQVPQPKGGVATVIGVDQPDNCLRIRSGPGLSYDIIGCANMGEQLNITGVWTSNDWAQLADNAWVYGPQIETDLRPPRTAYSSSPSYVITEEVTPDYYDWSYLPSYGYDTYWYGGVPIFLYNIGVWNKFHPWWWHRGHHAWWWQGGHRGKRAWNATAFNNFARARTRGGVVANRANISSFNRAGTPRSFTTNRSNISPSNVNRFNTNRLRSSTANTIRSGQSFSNPNTIRSLRSFSSPNTIRMRSNSGVRSFNTGNINTRRFNTGSINTRSLNTGSFNRGNFSTRSFNTGNIGTRSLGAVRGGGFSGARIGGGGMKFGGGGGNFAGAAAGGRRR